MNTMTNRLLRELNRLSVPVREVYPATYDTDAGITLQGEFEGASISIRCRDYSVTAHGAGADPVFKFWDCKKVLALEDALNAAREFIGKANGGAR